MAQAPDSSEHGPADALRVVLIYAAFSGLWILLSDRLVGILARSPSQAVLLNTLKGWVFVLVTCFLVYRLVLRREDPDPRLSSFGRRPALQASLAVLVIAALVGVGIRQVYRHREQLEFTRLQAIADLKAKEVNQWMQERLGDARFAAGSGVWSRAYHAWKRRGDLAEREHLLTRLEEMRADKGFQRWQVLDGDGRLEASTPGTPGSVPAPLKAAVLRASRSGQVSSLGPYWDESGVLRLDFIAPLPGEGGAPGPVVVFGTDPSVHLFPVLQAWPIPSATGEVMMFRRQGDDLIILTASGARPDLPFGRVRSLGENDLVAARALRSGAEPGTLQKGRDYRGTEVLAVFAPLPVLDAFLAAKIDLAEARAATWDSVAILGLAGLLALLLTLAAQHVFRQHRRLAEAARDRDLQAGRIRALGLVEGITSGSSDAIFAVDRQGRFLLFNPEAERTYGRKAAEVLGRTVEDLVPGHQGERMRRAGEEIRQHGRTLTLEQTLPGPQGHRTFLVSLGPLRDEAGGILGQYGIAKDITLLKDAERTARAQNRLLEASSRRFQQLFEAAPMPLALVGSGGRLVAVNGQFTTVTGYRLEDVPTVEAWFVKAYPDPAARERAKAIWTGRLQGPEAAGARDSLVTCADGQVRVLQISATAIGEEMLVSLADLTDRVREERERHALEVEVRQAQKMESIGRLAGGVAHDFNNVLGVIVANVELGLLQVPTGPALARFEDIRTAALRSADLTRQLLGFARKQAVSPRALDLNEAIPGLLKMLARIIGENITLDYAERPGLWPVRIDPTQLDQVLANLAVNARDAIEGVGILSIRTENAAIADPDPVLHPRRRAGDFVLLEVGDTGHGMTPEVLDHIFEPFYTTKGQGRGTGLGLATVYGIVKQNGGFLEVESAPGRGSTFRVFLPRHSGEPEPRVEAAGGPAPGGQERILVVEDEPMNLEVTSRLLETLGYRVIPAASPGEALRLLEADRGDLDLLLTDVVMPGMDGHDLARRARAVRPGLKCLFMSGYEDDRIARQGVLAEDMRLLPKPFTLEQLAHDLRAVLDA